MTQAFAGDPEPMLRVTRLSKTYATRVVDQVDWTLKPGRVHALLGGNGSGKSTLLKMIAGVVRPDPGGIIEVGGQSHASDAYTPSIAAAADLRFVHQDLGLVDDMSIANNFALANSYPRTRLGSVDDRALARNTADLLERRRLTLRPEQLVSSLRPTERTLVAIARAFDGIGAEPAMFVLDEPTASLPMNEVDHLFEAIRELREQGHGVVFVSHRLGEVAEIADDVTILRDGHIVGQGPIEDFPEAAIIELMAGHPRTEMAPDSSQIDYDVPPALSVNHLSAGPLRDVSLEVAQGEIVGVAGLVGAGRSSLLRSIFGDLPGSGTVSVGEQTVPRGSTKAAVRAGVAMVPENRQAEAAYLGRPIWENMSSVILRKYRRHGRLSTRLERADAVQAMQDFSVRADNVDVPLAALSGGNQQKVIVARWLRASPRILLLDEPSQGVDAVARDEIHALIREAARAGTGVLVVSSDLEELEQLSHRIVVLQDGQITQQLCGDEVSLAALTQAMHNIGAQ